MSGWDLSSWSMWPALAAGSAWALATASVGWGWAWALGNDEDTVPPSTWAAVGWIVMAGFVVRMLATLALLAAGRFTPATALIFDAGAATLGAALGRRRWLADTRGAAVTFALLAAGATAILAAPRRGEWMIGGWDPGLYVCDGVRMSRTGALLPPPDPFFSALTRDEIAIFTRPTHGYVEAMPGVPVDPATRRIAPAFFRLTPTFAAMLHQTAGLRGAVRVNHFAGLLTLVLLWAAMRRLGLGLAGALAAVALVAGHPVWAYHLSFPTTEMLHLAVLAGLAALWPSRQRAGPTVAMAALLFLAVANRFSFLPMGGLLLFVTALADLAEADRRRVRWCRLAQLAGLIGGAFLDRWTSLAALLRFGPATTAMVVVFAMLAAAAIAVDMAGPLWPALSDTLRRACAKAAPATALVGMAVAVTVSPFLPGDLGEAAATWARGAAPFIGLGHVALGLAGMIMAAARPMSAPAPVRTWLLWLAAGAAITLALPQVAGLWPWASRRLLEYVLPLMAIAGGLAIDALGRRLAGSLRKRTVLAAAVVLAALAPSVRVWLAAARATEFDGVGQVLEPIAQRLGPRDVVLADHFRWGTPLPFLAGVSAVNGEALWSAPDREDRLRLALAVFARLRDEGWRIRVVTSTDEGLAVFPLPTDGADLDYDSGTVRLTETIQHPRARSFKRQEKSRRFRLYTLTRFPEPVPRVAP